MSSWQNSSGQQASKNDALRSLLRDVYMSTATLGVFPLCRGTRVTGVRVAEIGRQSKQAPAAQVIDGSLAGFPPYLVEQWPSSRHGRRATAVDGVRLSAGELASAFDCATRRTRFRV